MMTSSITAIPSLGKLCCSGCLHFFCLWNWVGQETCLLGKSSSSQFVSAEESLLTDSFTHVIFGASEFNFYSLVFNLLLLPRILWGGLLQLLSHLAYFLNWPWIHVRANAPCWNRVTPLQLHYLCFLPLVTIFLSTLDLSGVWDLPQQMGGEITKF
jgi:hypothetical protein